MRLGLDEVHGLTFQRPVATVYVGNPAIADITMIDARHFFRAGQGLCTQPHVALNQDGVQVFSTKHRVVASAGISNAHGPSIAGGPSALPRIAPASVVSRPRCPLGDGKDAYDPNNAVATIQGNNARGRYSRQVIPDFWNIPSVLARTGFIAGSDRVDRTHVPGPALCVSG